jgi:hypothetical protein
MAALEAIGNWRARFKEMPPDLTDCVPTRDPERPWLLQIVEPLPIDAPETAQPWCCYIQTVIFYEQPYRVEEGRNFASYGTVETRLGGDDVVEFEGELFYVMGGTVSWDGARWVMTHRLRRCDERLVAAVLRPAC